MSVLTKDVWEIREQDFPGTAPIDLQLRFLLRYAILAPSTRNTQPWRFGVEANTVQLFADPERGQPVSDPDERELYISLGCALENLLVGAEHFGFRHEVTYFPEPGNAELAASIAFAPGGTPSPARAGITLDAIVRRHNDKSGDRGGAKGRSPTGPSSCGAMCCADRVRRWRSPRASPRIPASTEA